MINKLTAAPIVKKHREHMPAPAYTDFVKIFISDELNTSEESVAIRHEQAHIWCEHNRRTKKEYNPMVWAISCEIEIARNIYSENDISTIEAPRSRLNGGYLPDSIKNLPIHLNYAEEIYEWLKNNPQEAPLAQTLCGCKLESEGKDDQSDLGDVSSVVTDAKNSLDKLASVTQTQEDLRSKLSAIKYKTPSLADEMDAILRHRVIREKSFRRPSRRSDNVSFIGKGCISRRKRPLVEIFVDRSGSFNDAKTIAAESALKSILSKYNTQILLDVFFFGGDKLSSDNIAGGGNTPYHLIIDHLNATIPKIAVVITDDDAAGKFKNKPPKHTQILCLPIDCSATKFSAASGGRDVTF